MTELLEHDELCPIPVEQRMPDAVYCLWCEVLMKARIDTRLAERERITLAWQWRDWPLITESVRRGEVIGAAQAVTDWLRAGGGLNEPDLAEELRNPEEWGDPE